MGPLKITWINPDRIVVQANQPTCQRVDVRLRSILPGQSLARRGHHVAAVAMIDLTAWDHLPASYAANVYIIGKTMADVSPFARKIRQAGGKIILDVCDNVFEPPEDGPKPFTQAVLPLVHGVVTSTEMLQTAIAPHIPTGIPIAAIADCVEGQRQRPQFAPTLQPLKLLWFGYWNNLPHLQRLLPQLAGLPVPIELTIVTGWAGRFGGSLEGKGIETRLVEWSCATLAAELSRTDIVVVPSSSEPAYWTRSPNRLITALWAGRYVVAYPLPSYRSFAAFAGIGEDLPGKIVEALRDPAGTQARIAAGQEYIAAQFNTEAIAGQWESFARRLCASG